MKKFFALFCSVALVAGLTVVNTGCNKKDGPKGGTGTPTTPAVTTPTTPPAKVTPPDDKAKVPPAPEDKGKDGK